jgi:hypothetical protein
MALTLPAGGKGKFDKAAVDGLVFARLKGQALAARYGRGNSFNNEVVVDSFDEAV